jgi:hypothetical protein
MGNGLMIEYPCTGEVKDLWDVNVK